MSDFLRANARLDDDDLIEVFAVDNVEETLFRPDSTLQADLGPWFDFHSSMMTWRPDHVPNQGTICNLSWRKFAEPYPKHDHRWVRWYEIKLGNEIVLVIMSPHLYKTSVGSIGYYDHRFSVKARKPEDAALVLMFKEHIISDSEGFGWSAFQTGASINGLY